MIDRSPLPGAPSGASAWHIRYRSIDGNGKPVEITGVVIVPQTPAPKEGRAVVAWAHATVGIAESCAPSMSPKLFQDIDGLEGMLAAGYVVTATDFQGLGTPGPLPFLVGVSSGRAVLDSVRAARALPEAEAGKRVVLWGESQGAHAVLWAGQIAPTYAPDLDVLGIAAASPPTDLVANFAKLKNPIAHALMTGYVTADWSDVYGIKLSTFSNAIGRYLIRKLAKDCVRVDPVAAASNVGLLLLSNQIPYGLSQDWAKPLRENSVRPIHLAVPLLVVMGTEDPVVIPEVTRAYVAQSCRAGNIMRFLTEQGADHSNAGLRSAQATLVWIADRFAGKTPPSDCGAIEQAPADR